MKQLFFSFLFLWTFTSSAHYLSLKMNDFSLKIDENDITNCKNAIKQMAHTLHITSIIATLSTGTTLLKNTYQHLTKSEKMLIKKCILILVALWLVSTQLFWICLYAVGTLAHQFHDKKSRKKLFSSIQKTIATFANKIIVH